MLKKEIERKDREIKESISVSLEDLKIDNALLRKEIERMSRYLNLSKYNHQMDHSDNEKQEVEVNHTNPNINWEQPLNTGRRKLKPFSPGGLTPRSKPVIVSNKKPKMINQGTDPISILKKVHFDKQAKPEFKFSNPNKELQNAKKKIKQQEEIIKKQKDKIAQLETELLDKQVTIKDQEDQINEQVQQNSIDNKIKDDIEIGHIVPRLRLCLQVFENNLHEYLFQSKTTMTKSEFLATLLEKLNIEKVDDALILANYFIPQDSAQIQTWKVLEKIIEIAGEYRSFKDSDFVKLKNTFESADPKKRELFLNRLNILIRNGKSDHVTCKNFTLF